MVKENWTEVWTVVKVSDLGNFDFDGEKIKAIANKRQVQPKKYDKPTLIKVKMSIGSAGSDSRKKQIICIDTNELFESLRAASKHTKTSPSMLCRCIQWGKADINGLHWAYYTENAPR